MAPGQTYRVLHETCYTYSHKVTVAHQLAHLKPRTTGWQQVQAHTLTIQPEPGGRAQDRDYFGNDVERFELDTPHDELVVKAESVVMVAGHAPDARAAIEPWEAALAVPGVWGPGVDLDVEQYRMPSPLAPVLAEAREYAAASFTPGRPWLEAMLELTIRIRKEFTYDTKATTVTTKVSEVIARRRGVCQDFAHAMISSLRALGMPARYVSGYVLNQPAQGAAMVGADASHAWVAGHCPGLGWVDFDPTNGKLADTEFVTLGWGRDYLDVAPLRGVVLGAATQKLQVAVSVRPE
jgi:transglutaminase-like putative cysteine protease